MPKGRRQFDYISYSVWVDMKIEFLIIFLAPLSEIWELNFMIFLASHDWIYTKLKSPSDSWSYLTATHKNNFTWGESQPMQGQIELNIRKLIKFPNSSFPSSLSFFWCSISPHCDGWILPCVKLSFSTLHRLKLPKFWAKKTGFKPIR